MEEAFWQSRWAANEIGFHEERPNPFLTSHVDRLGLAAGGAVFAPLCGKSVDLDWLRQRGLHVVGIEFNERAVRAVFERNGLTPEVSALSGLTLYGAERLKLFVGDFFQLTADMLGAVNAVFDRGAIVALPQPTRERYAERLSALTATAPQLVVSYDYDQRQMDGPPFSVTRDQINRLYKDHYTYEELSRAPIAGPLSNRCSGEEFATLLTPQS